jgi:hypothetical protein
MESTPPTPEPGCPPSADAKKAPEGLTDGQQIHAKKFCDWLMRLNRDDYIQAAKVLNALTHAYFKHTVKVHSPPMRENDVPSETSDGPESPNLRDPDPAA